jgi:hypothetical protein
VAPASGLDANLLTRDRPDALADAAASTIEVAILPLTGARHQLSQHLTFSRVVCGCAEEMER